MFGQLKLCSMLYCLQHNLKKTWAADDLNESDKFLRDYILNKRHITDANAADAEGDGELPTYDEIVALDEEEEKREQFEVNYNFRYEEPDQNFVRFLVLFANHHDAYADQTISANDQRLVKKSRHVAQGGSRSS